MADKNGKIMIIGGQGHGYDDDLNSVEVIDLATQSHCEPVEEYPMHVSVYKCHPHSDGIFIRLLIHWQLLFHQAECYLAVGTAKTLDVTLKFATNFLPAQKDGIM